MTCEVAIMNRRAVVLAANSALTASTWVDGKSETRYFKGSNKIFHCSEYHPIGLMTYDNADLQKIPWEPIVKAFPAALNGKSFNDVRGYGHELFDFIGTNSDILPIEARDAYLHDKVRETALCYILNVMHSEEFTAASDDDARRSAAAESLRQAKVEISTTAFFHTSDQVDFQDAWSTHEHKLKERIAHLLDPIQVASFFECDVLAQLALETLLKMAPEHSLATGIVMAGYGDKEYLPHLCEYKCYGVFIRKVLFESKDERAIRVRK